MLGSNRVSNLLSHKKVLAGVGLGIGLLVVLFLIF